MPKMEFYNTEFEFSVTNYNKEDEHYVWADTLVSIKNEYVNYSCEYEFLMKQEIKGIIEGLDDLIHDRMKKKENWIFAEPGCLEMEFCPAEMEFFDRTTCAHRTRDCFFTFSVVLSINAPASFAMERERWSITLNRNDIMVLLEGLEKETGLRTQPRAKMDLIGVSFLGKPTEVFWYSNNKGFALEPRDMVTVEHDGKEETAFVEYVRKNYIDSLPCPGEEIKDIIGVLDEDERDDLYIDVWQCAKRERVKKK